MHPRGPATETIADPRGNKRMPASVPAVVVGTLALAIGAGTAVFSLFDAVVLNPLPVESPSELVLLRENDGMGFSYPMTLNRAGRA